MDACKTMSYFAFTVIEDGIQWAKTLKLLTFGMNNKEHLALQYSAGRPWILVLVWMSENTTGRIRLDETTLVKNKPLLD